ncbi:MAG: EAL domain-containing protein [Desulfovibrionaceae bacterium]|nr:EAL domain-containing protein [Desulfovibrionaceae bacterium]
MPTLLVGILLMAGLVAAMLHIQNDVVDDFQRPLLSLIQAKKDIVDTFFAEDKARTNENAQKLVKRHAGNVDRMAQACLDYGYLFADTKGRAYLAGGAHADVSNEPAYKSAKNSKKDSPELAETRFQQNAALLGVPLFDKTTRIGVLLKAYSAQDLSRILSVSGISDNYALRRQTGERVSATHPKHTQCALTEKDLTLDQGVRLLPGSEGNTTLFAYARLSSLPFYLTGEYSEEELIPNTKRNIHWIFALILTCGILFLILLFSFTAGKHKEERDLRKAAFHDSTTMGFSFTMLVVYLPEYIKKKPEAPWYLLAFDIDQFRYINSAYSSEHGNIMLREVTRKISARLGPDEFLTHVWGDYFAALICRPHPETDDTLLAPIRTLWDLSVRFSGGLYRILDPTEDVRAMYDKASLASQSVKKDIHATLCLYEDSLNRKMLENETVKQRIQKALVAQEIIPFFQPKVRIDNRAIVGAEALARWRLPDGSTVSPASFIPICESSGLILEVDLAIFDGVLRFLQKMPEPSIPISVNFSRRHFMRDNFFQYLVRRLKDFSIPPQLIEVELTESLFYENQNRLADLVQKLHSLGIRVSMDDFGTGYSSLGLLKDIHIDVLKIDQSFLKETAFRNKRDIVFSSITEMASKLGIDVVVEGVETDEHIALMQSCSCSIAQGYYFAKPLEPETFETVYRQGFLEAHTVQ